MALVQEFGLIAGQPIRIDQLRGQRLGIGRTRGRGPRIPYLP
jgi:hypothetical protein